MNFISLTLHFSFCPQNALFLCFSSVIETLLCPIRYMYEMNIQLCGRNFDKHEGSSRKLKIREEETAEGIRGDRLGGKDRCREGISGVVLGLKMLCVGDGYHCSPVALWDRVLDRKWKGC